ncbi:RNA polymerase recycling motor ATPase HelR [Raineyella sp.]|uniref:RNA polymerase recycling motor ATPase HelR n=1 Tax=Raineyella sp. TaxID=1911550 RepID=UPI002B21366E|nr:RNA polymerase recycling motor ATPase HelR [Raineyella sp.]MEA5155416.1 RNA polymerase recycling motor ATPase HelR [Raineyella sp.]
MTPEPPTPEPPTPTSPTSDSPTPEALTPGPPTSGPPTSGTTFDLPPRLAAKADPDLIGQDEAHFALVSRALRQHVTALSGRLDALRRSPGGRGPQALERDLEIHRLSARLRVLQRFGPDVCLGRMVAADVPAPVYVGRLGLVDPDGVQLLVDWRAPAAEPYFAATHGAPMGLVSRRRYRWHRGRVVDYWDEVFSLEGVEGLKGRAALDDQSAFIAELCAARTPRMRDVLATIQADQDAVIRAGSHGALVVEGGPGTGKTVVALHRAAYLLHADPRLAGHRGGVLFVGPHQAYLDYVADVLPDLGEDGVVTCLLRELVPEGATAGVEADPEVARLKSAAAMVSVVEPAVALYEEPPAEGMTVETDGSDIRLSADDWAEAFATPDPGTPHNEARDEVWDALVEILVDNSEDADVPRAELRRSVQQHEDLRDTFRRAWPILRPTDLVSDLWAVPAYLRHCAPWLGPEQRRLLRRPEGSPWTVSDLPLLDAMRQRLGDPDASAQRRRREAAVAEERRYRADLADYLMTHDDTEMQVMSMLRGEDLQQALVDEAELPDVVVPTSVRRSGVPVRHGSTAERDGILRDWLAGHPEGIACVVGDPTVTGTDRVRSLPAEEVKGLEYDLVVLVDPERWGTGIEGAVDRYVAMTRSTRALVILTAPPGPGARPDDARTPPRPDRAR